MQSLPVFNAAFDAVYDLVLDKGYKSLVVMDKGLCNLSYETN